VLEFTRERTSKAKTVRAMQTTNKTKQNAAPGLPEITWFTFAADLLYLPDIA
jgi:hypothetical protein